MRDAPGEDALVYVPSFGAATGLWWGEPTGDMRPDDAGSLCFDTPPLDEGFAIVGLPKVRLRVSADAPLAHWAARLEDVLPDGRVSLVTGALLPGAQRMSRLEPEALVPGEAYDLEFDLHFTTWTFKPGHRVRLSVSNALFPMIWPTPHPMTTRLATGKEATRLELPVIPGGGHPAPAFRAPEPRETAGDARDLGGGAWPAGRTEWRRDIGEGKAAYEWRGETVWEVRGVRFRATERNVYETDEKAPARSRFLGEDTDRIELPGRTLDLRTEVEIRSDDKDFHVMFVRRILENGRLVRRREWTESVPRELN